MICAVASYLDARANAGRWLLRMEDLDPPREAPGAADAILHGLEAHGLHWDGAVLWQGPRGDAYAAAVADLQRQGLAFPCDCSRARLAAWGNIYPGHCRDRQLAEAPGHALRVRVDGIGNTHTLDNTRTIDNTHIEVQDLLQQPLTQDLATEVGDFIIRRRDGLHAYQLAVVVDDASQQVTRVVRGSDLYDSTPRQIYLQHLLRLPTPEYAHIPVITNALGHKLSKQTFAPALDNRQAAANLRLALRFLGQPAPDPTLRAPAELLRQATAQWSLGRVPATAALPQSSLA